MIIENPTARGASGGTISSIKTKDKNECPCKRGKFKYGSALYEYYSCGHALEKPLNDKETARWVYYPSPYECRKRG